MEKGCKWTQTRNFFYEPKFLGSRENPGSFTNWQRNQNMADRMTNLRSREGVHDGESETEKSTQGEESHPGYNASSRDDTGWRDQQAAQTRSDQAAGAHPVYIHAPPPPQPPPPPPN